MQLNILLPINNLSYGVVGINLLKELTKKHQISLFPIGGIEAESDNHGIIQQALENSKFYNPKAPDIRLFHQHLLAEHVSKTCRIGFPIFELDTFNEVERHHLNNQDMLFVPSKWAKAVVEKNNIAVPTYVIPLGVDRNIFHENIASVRSDKTIFFHCSKIEIRKGHAFLPQLFKKAGIKDYELWISWFNPFLPDKEVREWHEYYKKELGDNVKFLPWTKTQAELASLMARTDVGIWPSLAEGWLLPCLEYMSLGKPVITTNYSAQTEYCNKENSFLIEPDEVEPAYDGRWFFGQGNWMQFGKNQEEQAIEYIRKAHNLKKEELFNPNGIETAKQFSWANSVKAIEGVLSGY